MKITNIYYTSSFKKRFKKAPSTIKRLAYSREKLFRDNPLHPQLKTHQLTGNLKGFYSFSINYQYRVLFVFENKGEVTFIDVGTHSVYR